MWLQSRHRDRVVPEDQALAQAQTGHATASPAPDPRDSIVDGLASTWDNRAQFDTAPATLKVPPAQPYRFERLP